MPYVKKNMWVQAAKNTKEMNEQLTIKEQADLYQVPEDCLVEDSPEQECGVDYASMEEKMLAFQEHDHGMKKMADQWSDMQDTHIIKQVLEKGLKMKIGEPAEEIPEDHARFLRNRAEEMLVWYPRRSPGGGYDDHTVALDPIPHFNVQDLLARFFIQTHAHYGVVQNWRQNVIGVCSLYSGDGWGWNMPMFDYDGKNVKTQIRKDTKALQHKWGLGDAWVYETRRGFHVYFFCDKVSKDDYFAMLEEVQGCKGFKRATTKRGYGVLRVSAKYTDFDIKPLYTLPSGSREKLRRMGRKAHTIRALLALGEECGTHFAAMFPQWAHFKQDQKEWKPAPKRKTRGGKRIRKVSMRDYEMMNHEKKLKKMQQQQAPTMTIGTTATTNATVTFSNTWTSTGNGTGDTSF